MTPVSMVVLILATICGYVGIYHLLFYIRIPGHREHLFFSFTCFSITLYDICCAGLYSATTIPQGMFWQRYQFAALALFTIAILWFTRAYTLKRIPLRVLIPLSITCVVFLVAGLVTEGSAAFIHTGTGPRHVTIGSFIDLRYPEATPGYLYMGQYVFMMALSVYVLAVLIRHWLSEEHRTSGPVVLAMTVFFAACINDALVGMGVYDVPYILEYTYLFVTLSMAFVLTGQFVQLHKEVQEMNMRLEGKVNDRTIDLLFSEIGRKLYVEMLSGTSSHGDESIISRLSRDISILSHTDELFHRAATRAREISQSAQACIFLVDETETLQCKASDTADDASILAYNSSLVQASYRDKKPVISGKNSSELTIPIKLGEDVIGIGYFQRFTSHTPFTDNDIPLLEAFINQTARALEDAFLYQRLTRQKNREKQHTLSPAIEAKMQKAMQYLDDNFIADISREGLAASLNMHPDSLSRFFKIFTNMKMGDYINSRRVEYAAGCLRDTDESIITVAHMAGFESLTTFNRTFQKIMKMTPSACRNQYRAG
jgi:AraC-like DNA-binding protein